MNLIFLKKKDMGNFYNYYLEQNRIKDIQNQKECVEAAKSIKLYLTGSIQKLPQKYNWLYEKLTKNIEDNYRGQLVVKNIIGIIEEIIDMNNSASKLYWSKSPRKQKIEEIQRNFISFTHGLTILAGKQFGVCASGNDSYRFIYETSEFKKGINKKEGITTKSMDGLILQTELNTDLKCWVFQKVTTDDGGSTNSVEEEVIETIKVANKNVNNFPVQNIFVFLLDGPYWERKQYKKDNKTRFEKIFEMSSGYVIVCNSNTIKSELIKRKIINPVTI
jgi:hypothetical protein